MVLADPRPGTLAGPAVSDAGATARTITVDRPAIRRTGRGGQGGPDGAAVGPRRSARSASTPPRRWNKGPLGASIGDVPVVGDNAILLAGDCWNGFAPGDLKGTPYRGPLAGDPRQQHLRPVSLRRGFVAVPLKSVEGLLE